MVTLDIEFSTGIFVNGHDKMITEVNLVIGKPGNPER